MANRPKPALMIAIAFAALLMIGAILIIRLPLNLPITKIILPYGINFSDNAKLRKRLKLQPGFRFNIYATGLGGARLMAITPGGDILLTVPSQGKVKLIARDQNGDGQADNVKTLLSGLNHPHGLQLHKNYLYIAEANQVVRYPIDLKTPKITGKSEAVLKDIPEAGGHRTRTIKIGPSGWFYLTIGSSCNVCVESHPWRATMLRFKQDGSALSIFATGLRNSVGFDWHPGTRRLYGVENSRDWLGDEFPPDELNHIEKNGFYGWPYRHGNNIADPDFGKMPASKAKTAIAPAFAFKAHVAPLSIRFLHHTLARDYHHSALVALHGSWNRSKKIGYEIVSLHWGENGEITQKPFLTGFLNNDEAIGRPVDILEAPDGTIYISDDLGGAIYRITPDRK